MPRQGPVIIQALTPAFSVGAPKESGYAGVLAVESDHHKDKQNEDQLVADSVAYLKKLVAEL